MTYPEKLKQKRQLWEKYINQLDMVKFTVPPTSEEIQLRARCEQLSLRR